MQRKGMLFAAGMITGEALMGIIIALPIVGSGRADVAGAARELAIRPPVRRSRCSSCSPAWLYRTATGVKGGKAAELGKQGRILLDPALFLGRDAQTLRPP